MKSPKSLIMFGMVRRSTAGLLAVLMLVMAISGGSQAGEDGTLKWVYDISGTAGTAGIQSPALGPDGTVYMGGGDGNLHAVNPDGTAKWASPYGFGGSSNGYPISTSPSVGPNGDIYVGSEDGLGLLYAFKPDGSDSWQYAPGLPAFHGTPAVGSDGTIYIAWEADGVHALNPDGTPKWTLPIEYLSSSPSIAADGTIYAGAINGGGLYASYPDGDLKWEGCTSSPNYNDSVVIGADGTLYLGAYIFLLAINSADCTVRWSTALSTYGWVFSPVIGADGTLYALSTDGKLHALNPDGTVKWQLGIGGISEPSTPAIGADGTVYVGGRSGCCGRVYAVNPNGTVKWYFDTDSGPNSPTLGPDGTLYVATGYYLYAINTTSGGLANSAWPMYQHDAKHTGLAVAAGNSPPTVDPINAPIEPILITTAVTASATFADPNTQDTHTAVWDWGDGSSSAASINESNGLGSVSGSHVYAAPGVYRVTLTVTDNRNGSGQAVLEYIVVYDPSGGFVTGGGWINSPLGGYPIAPSLSGKASFGFVSKYQKGATVPSGETQFKFHVADMNFKSTSYQWLVVAGARAQFKGEGTINGSGSYGFLLTAIDGQQAGGGGQDRFRIKIWDKASGQIVYDNQLGAADDSYSSTAISGGSIVIHK